MATPKMSFKQIQNLHKSLGGRSRGYFITEYGVDKETGQGISIDERIARFERKNASADYFLVKGRPYQKR